MYPEVSAGSGTSSGYRPGAGRIAAIERQETKVLVIRQEANVKVKSLVLIFAGMTVLGVRAHAHHSFAGTYLGDQRITIEADVSKFLYRNPHSFLELETKDATGNADHLGGGMGRCCAACKRWFAARHAASGRPCRRGWLSGARPRGSSPPHPRSQTPFRRLVMEGGFPLVFRPILGYETSSERRDGGNSNG